MMNENQLGNLADMIQCREVTGEQFNTIMEASFSSHEGTQSVGAEITQGAEIIEYTEIEEEEGDELVILEEHAQIANDGQLAESYDSLLGITRKTVDEMYELYCEHAKEKGFSVRKSTARLSTTGVVLAKMFLCSCAGMRKLKTGSPKNKMFGITRTNCKALMAIKLIKEGVYVVVKHELTHNHQLTRREWSHLHRSQRRITNDKGKVIENMMLSGMRATESFNYLVSEVGDEESVGHTKRDHKNFINNWKMKRIEAGDAQTFFDMIVAENKKDQGFFYSVKLDGEGRLSSVFWRDSLMKEDFSIYGDVVVFDTTYRTNKYNLICAPFVGANNHRKNVFFGCAFISDEKAETFEWVFEKFRKSMEDKHPVTIFTDQDAAIASGIQKVFPETNHRLCIWHIYQNAMNRFGKLKTNASFISAFNKCLSGCLDESEFENCWKNMITTYGLQEKSWFKRLYELRDKWCTGLNKNYFSAGMVSSQRSESTNYSLSFKARRDTSITNFYILFKERVREWRNNEIQDEFNCAKSEPQTFLQKKGLIKHAMEVYTSTMFRDFEREFNICITASFNICYQIGSMVVYNVAAEDESSGQVTFDDDMKLVKCNCMKYEECGMLCYHCLRILNINSVQKIPDAYIMKRWTKNAKSKVWDSLEGQLRDGRSVAIDAVLWKSNAQRKYYNLFLESQGNEAARVIIDEGFIKMSAEIKALESTEQEECMISDCESSRSVLDPARSKTKGRNKRVKNYLEKNKKKRASTLDSIASLEFGSKTPNPRLF